MSADETFKVSTVEVTAYGPGRSRSGDSISVPVDGELFATLDAIGRWRLHGVTMADGSTCWAKRFFDAGDTRRVVRIGLGAYGHGDGEGLNRESIEK